MKEKLKTIIKKIVPEAIILRLFNFRHMIASRWKAKKCKEIFEKSPLNPEWLGIDLLESLQEKYPFPDKSSYGYDPLSCELRGKERADLLIRMIGKETNEINNFLELGCNDGMVSCFLQHNGKVAVGIDMSSKGFDRRALEAGVKLIEMDATRLNFKDNSFDFIYSFAAFEHFSDPELVLKEAMRVVKTGGYIYLNFGPLYMSSEGLHAYYSITVPYCQFLFPKEMIADFITKKGLQKVDFDDVNKWTVRDYRNLWNKYSSSLKKVRYLEGYDLRHLDLIMKYPSCFRSKTDFFDNLIVSSIEVLFMKIK